VCPHLHRDLQQLRSLGVAAGVALNPSTPVAMLSEVLPDLDSVLIMSVNPGFGGQKFIPSALRRIAELRQMVEQRGLRVEIAVDGGVNEETAADVLRAGADTLIIGSALFRHPGGPGAVLELVRREAVSRP
jgi:ribulose-phosphate 3-epimerase